MPQLPTSHDDMQVTQVLFERAMHVTDQAEADGVFAELLTIARRATPEVSLATMTANLRESLGYHAGYFDHATRARVERLYRCAHPFFGPIAHVLPPEPGESLELGRMNMERFKRGEPFITLTDLRAARSYERKP
jgi:hypothetical protein